MSMNRRNVLIGLGAVAAGGGAVLGSGAFSQVTADRTVSVSAAADSSAQLGIAVTGDLAGSNNDTIAFELGGNGVNLDAVTRFDGALTITNNGTNAVDVDILDGSSASMVDGATAAATSTDMTFEPTTAGDENGVASGGGTVTFDVVFDLTDTTTTGNENIPGSVTVEAVDST